MTIGNMKREYHLVLIIILVQFILDYLQIIHAMGIL